MLSGFKVQGSSTSQGKLSISINNAETYFWLRYLIIDLNNPPTGHNSVAQGVASRFLFVYYI